MNNTIDRKLDKFHAFFTVHYCGLVIRKLSLTIAITMMTFVPAISHAQVIEEKFLPNSTPQTTATPRTADSPLVAPTLTVIDAGAVLAAEKTVACSNTIAVPKLLDLANAIDLTLCNNRQLRSTWAAIKLQDAAADEARSNYFPDLSVSNNRLRNSSINSDSERESNAISNTVHSGLNWRIADSGTREADRRVSDSLLLAALATHDAKLQKTLADTTQAYFDAQSARTAWRAKQSSEQIARDTLANAKRRGASRKTSKGDADRALVAVSRAALEMHRASSQYRRVLSNLAKVMGLPSDTPLQLADESIVVGNALEIDNIVALNARDLQTYLQQAQDAHPAIQAAREKWHAAQDKLSASRTESQPTVDLSANSYRNSYPGQAPSSANPKVNSIGIAINIPIFDGFSRNYKIRQEKNQVDRREHDLEQTEQNVIKEVIKAHADTVSSTDKLRQSEAARDSASQALIVVRRKYITGAADITEMLNAQAALEQAQQDRISALAQWRSTRLRLVSSMGILGIQSIYTSGKVSKPASSRLVNLESDAVPTSTVFIAPSSAQLSVSTLKSQNQPSQIQRPYSSVEPEARQDDLKPRRSMKLSNELKNDSRSQ
jgi:outer membrane protein